jgi:hypothetical protein
LAVARRKKLGMLDHYPDKQQALNISGSILPALIEKLCGTFAKFEVFIMTSLPPLI